MAVAVSLAAGTPAEQAVASQLAGFFARFDLTPWEFTTTVVIDESDVPPPPRLLAGARALRTLLGEPDAAAHLERVTEVGVYRWVYATVARDFDTLATLYGPLGLRIVP